MPFHPEFDERFSTIVEPSAREAGFEKAARGFRGQAPQYFSGTAIQRTFAEPAPAFFHLARLAAVKADRIARLELVDFLPD